MRNVINSRGAILLSSLWILVILMLMAAGITFRTRLMIKLADGYLDSTRNFQHSLADYYTALGVLQEDYSKEYRALTDKWAQNQYSISDEERNININTAPVEILLRLPGLTEKHVDALIDWRDKDSNELPEGAEDEYYQDNEFPYHSKNGPFEYTEELLMVKGFTPDIISEIKEMITVYGNGAVNINTAQRDVLETLGIDDPLIDIIMNYRQGYDGIIGTADDQVFTSAKTINTVLNEFEPINPSETTLLQNLISQGLLDVSSSYFTITSHGYSKNPADATIISATVSLSTEGVEVIKWQVKH